MSPLRLALRLGATPDLLFLDGILHGSDSTFQQHLATHLHCNLAANNYGRFDLS